MTSAGTERIFKVREADEERFWVKAPGESIVTEAEMREELKHNEHILKNDLRTQAVGDGLDSWCV